MAIFDGVSQISLILVIKFSASGIRQIFGLYSSEQRMEENKASGTKKGNQRHRLGILWITQ